MTDKNSVLTDKNIAVIGAGIAGSLMAYQLIRLGFSVSIFEQEQDQEQAKKSCSYTAAGMLAPMSELESADDGVYKLGIESLKLWPEILTQLDHEYGHKVFYSDKGSLVVCHSQDQGSFNQFYSSLKFKLADKLDGLCSSVLVKDYEPELAKFTHGLLLNNEAQLDSHQLLNALHSVIKQHGNWFNQKINSIKAKGLTLENGTELTMDWVFDCRGLEAKNKIKGLHGVRGERILVHAPSVNIDRMVRLMHPRYQLYIAPREHGHYIIGATEIESSDHGPISVRSALELLSAAFSLHSGFAEARIVEMRTGLRPTRLDHQPYLNTEDGLTAINGFYRHGYLIGPAVIKQALDQFIHAIKKPADALLAHNALLKVEHEN
jgi:glycine oxidase